MPYIIDIFSFNTLFQKKILDFLRKKLKKIMVISYITIINELFFNEKIFSNLSENENIKKI